MEQPFDLSKTAMVAVARESLLALRVALVRDLGPDAAAYLQEAGYAGGESLFAAFGRWMNARGLGIPEALPASDFARRATEFFRATGWGAIEVGSLGEAIATVDSLNWAEADPASGLEYPSCHLTTGMFADFFGRLAGTPLAVMEVECRSMGTQRCRFLVGGAEAMQRLYDDMSQGVPYEESAAQA